MGKVTDKHGKPLKAYHVQSDDEGCIVFESNSASARRHGAGELGLDWEDIQTCRRVSWADSYAQDRRVPPLVMIEHGWWYECCNCGCRVSDEGYYEDDEGNEVKQEPVEHNGFVFCTPACRDAELKEQADRQALKDAATKSAIDKFPGSEITWVGDFKPIQVMFKFPGGKYQATWTVGDELVSIQQSDVEAWNIYRAPYRAAEASA